LTASFDDTLKQISACGQPAWAWDSARRRIVFANPAGLAFWGEASLADLLDRRFAATDPAARAMSQHAPGGRFELPGPVSAGTAETAAIALRDGRPGLMVTMLPSAAPLSGDAGRLFAAAPMALAAFDAAGRRLASNDDAVELLMPGDLGIVFSNPYLAEEFAADAMARGMLARTVPVATRFGLRRCRVVARRMDDATGARLILAFEDIEDRLALDLTPPAVRSDARPLAAATPTPVSPPDMVAEPFQATAEHPVASSALEDVVAALPDATLASDAGGRVLAMNARAAQLLGEAAKGEPLLNMLPPALKGEAAAYIAAQGARWLERALEEGRELEMDRNGETVPVHIVFARLGGGEILVQFRDLSGVYKARQGLIEAVEKAETQSRMKSDYIAALSHELRTPLNAIIGFAEIMEQQRMGPLENAKYREYVGDIKSSGELLLSLINDLLDLSKAESGRIELDPDAVEIKPIVMGVISLLGPQAERYGVTLHATIAKDIPAIVADQRSLKQILLNLAGNAIKFNNRGGEVEITATLDAAGAVIITVRDNGPGMDADDLKAALEPYRRAKSARHREGTGLGLPLARALIEANKAQFTMDSAPGAGTVMRLTFPSTLVLAG
jgi:signal transduction histidine kinase